MKRKWKRSPVGRERDRVIKEREKRERQKAERQSKERQEALKVKWAHQILDRKLCVWLHIVGGMDHNGVLDELFEDICKAYCRISFPIVEIPEGPSTEVPCVRSERTRCITPEDAAIVDGELLDMASIKKPTRVEASESHLWHFAGGIWLTEPHKELCFCEYDADKREGGMMIFFDGRNIFQFFDKYPQLREKVRIADLYQYHWMSDNW